jgi:hypothetical protein
MANNWPTMSRRGPSIDDAAIAAFETTLGHPLPDDYRRFLLAVNGGRPSGTTSAPPGLSRINSLHSLGDPDEARQLLPTPRYGEPLPSRDLIAIGFEDGGCKILLCVTGEHRGEIWYLSGGDLRRPDDANPRVEWFRRRDMRKIADSFEQYARSLGPLEA